MKNLKMSVLMAALLCGVAAMLTSCASDQKLTGKPYTLTTCAVCGMSLADEKNPYAFMYQDRIIIVCDKDEAVTFKKELDKYLKIIEEGEAKAAARR